MYLIVFSIDPVTMYTVLVEIFYFIFFLGGGREDAEHIINFLTI